MTKWILTFLIIIATVQIAYATEECQGIIEPNDVPCVIKSSWEYDNCNSTQVKIFDSSPSLLEIRNFTEFGSSKRCNITWNYSTEGSYFWNVTNGDTGTITVEVEDEMASLTVMLFIGIITAAIFFIGIKVNFTENEVANFIIKRCIILFGLFILTLDMAMIMTVSDTGGLGLQSELYRFLWIILWVIRIYAIWLMWSTVQKGLTLYNLKKQNRQMGYD